MQIDHVVVLMLENRSFDHMLGFLDHPDPTYQGLTRGGPYANPGWDGGTVVGATPVAKAALPFGPDHAHDAVMEQLALRGRGARREATNQGFVSSYERKSRGLSQPVFGGVFGQVANWVRRLWPPAAATAEGRGPLAMLCQPPEHVPVLSRLALEFAICDRWFCSVPGETWPNRNFLHAATSDGETQIEPRFYDDPTIFELLEEHGRSWHIYHDDTPQVWAFPSLWDTPERHANWYRFVAFARHVAEGRLPAYSFIEPNHRPPLHMVDDVPAASNSQHPENNLCTDADYDGLPDGGDSDFARAEALIATVYEALRANPEVFERTVLLVTYDEHGGFYDHVPPPTDAAAPADRPGWVTRLERALWHRNTSAFDFTVLGPRVPAVLVSPFIRRGTVDHRTHDHACVPATLRELFAPDARPLTPRDGWAATFRGVVNLDTARTDLPDLSAYAGVATPVPAEARAGSPELGAPVPAAVPAYYQDFVDQAERVHERLLKVGEPEVLAVEAAYAAPRAADVTSAFQWAAHRHRHPEDGHQSTVER
jgi:phospholipase C